VLLVVHNVTSATRLLDVLPLLSGDLQVQLLATCTQSSPGAPATTASLTPSRTASASAARSGSPRTSSWS
jgi:hypothetical protein